MLVYLKRLLPFSLFLLFFCLPTLELTFDDSIDKRKNNTHSIKKSYYKSKKRFKAVHSNNIAKSSSLEEKKENRLDILPFLAYIKNEYILYKTHLLCMTLKTTFFSQNCFYIFKERSPPVVQNS